jgi:hypothetical protein
VLYFLIRTEPFTEYFLKMQGGSFDHGDRMFFSMAGDGHVLPVRVVG